MKRCKILIFGSRSQTGSIDRPSSADTFDLDRLKAGERPLVKQCSGSYASKYKTRLPSNTNGRILIGGFDSPTLIPGLRP